MTITIYTTAIGSSHKKVVQFLEEFNVPYEVVNLKNELLPYDVFIDMLRLAPDVQSIISKSETKKRMEEQGLDIDSLKISELYHLVAEHPKILKSPFIYNKSKRIFCCGYKEEYLQKVLRSRSEKKKTFQAYLKYAQELEAFDRKVVDVDDDNKIFE